MSPHSLPLLKGALGVGVCGTRHSLGHFPWPGEELPGGSEGVRCLLPECRQDCDQLGQRNALCGRASSCLSSSKAAFQRALKASSLKAACSAIRLQKKRCPERAYEHSRARM